MSFFRRRNKNTRLGEFLLSSGSLRKAGEGPSDKRPQVHDDDDIGWGEEGFAGPGRAFRTGLPVSKQVKTRWPM